ncbi:GspH/FimT family pseudopilin [Luteimonas sp. 3794]|uniref:GspH/FimT family pseudopilin n=1 Tax=Luteimonas sp. 3794 TaxID=2817730 RepID=UPI00286D42E5|nr:GspH/FimT family pseudopilin [Luteimonas sp. 3794]
MKGNVREPGGCGAAAGFTMVELMVTVAIIGILAVVAVPAMTGLINNSRLSGLSGEVVSAVQFARSEAVRRNARVTLCASADGLACSNAADWSRWIVLAPDNTSGGTDVVLDGVAPGNAQVSGPAGRIVFRPSGLVVSQAQLTACVPTTNPENNRRIVTVGLSGSPVTTRANGAGTCP